MSGCGQIISGELHYPRIPPEYWRDRLRMARAMGLNAVSTYVFWNRHEPLPGRFDFSGANDVAAFIGIAREEGLRVILRPGPYVCAEWDFGGLPAWLLRDGPIPIRSADEKFMTPVRTWLARLGEELAPLQAARGGPIIAVQLENEYGAFGSDRAYLTALRDALAGAGLGESPLFTIDQPGDLAAGSLDGVPIAVTFAPGDPAHIFERLRAVRPDAPLLTGEYWAGWFDHWGERREPLDCAMQERDLEWMLARGASVNVYMFHGGTNFGFWNGANSDRDRPYQPTTTSYDYEAALDEAGRPTPKYHAFRGVIERATKRAAPPVPLPPRAIDVGEFELTEAAPFSAILGEPFARETPQPMEAVGQSLGFILYRTVAAGPLDGMLHVTGLRDFAVVLIDGVRVGILERRTSTNEIRIASNRDRPVVELLVENCGRINYGADLPYERKGIDGVIRLDGVELRGWTIFPAPLDDLHALPFRAGGAASPAFYRGTFALSDTGDTFLDTAGLGKGVLWINGHNAGRFWSIGPQRSLYVPGVWLRAGTNEAIVLDLLDGAAPRRLRGVSRTPH